MGQVHLISRRCRCTPCMRCKALVLTGLDEGVPYRVDPLPLTANGEIVARLQGRKTYGLYSEYVHMRTAGRVMTDAKYGTPPVFATHVCGKPIIGGIEIKHVQRITVFLERLRKHPPYKDDEDVAPQEEEALFTISDLLSGKVIAVNDGTAPF